MPNKGKICVSICAETADELPGQIKLAREVGDVVEIRFDCLRPDEIDKFYAKFGKDWSIDKNIPFLTTFRPKSQGGARELTNDERNNFWAAGFEIDWADCEEDFSENPFIRLFDKRICSYHDFEGVPDDLFEIYERLKATSADVLKIAVQTDDVTDAIPVWKLLEKAKKDNRQIIPIAMGESGKWTRILGLAHGAFMTYASLDAGRETAPGQVSAGDLREVYRARELTEKTDVYGILGNNTSVSMSPYMHNAAFQFHKLDAVFVPFQVQDLDEFIKRMVKPATREIELNFKGFAVTIPHKQSIIKHLDEIDESAKKIGAVNTVKIIDGRLYGYNTDAQGFIEPLKNAYGDLQNTRVAVIGAGGAARACIYALTREGARVTIFARDSNKARVLAEEFDADFAEIPIRNPKSEIQNQDILVNTTPLGMKGKAEGQTPVTTEHLKGFQLVYDLVYNPFQTPLMTEADLSEVPKIGGLAMLVAQAVEQQKIWTGLDAPLKEMSRACLERL